MTLVRSIDPFSGVPIFLPLISLAAHEASRRPRRKGLSVAAVEALEELTRCGAEIFGDERSDAKRRKTGGPR